MHPVLRTAFQPARTALIYHKPKWIKPFSSQIMTNIRNLTYKVIR